MSKKKDDGYLYYDTETGLPLSNDEGQKRAEIRYEQEVLKVIDNTYVDDRFRHYHGIDQDVHDNALERLAKKEVITKIGNRWQMKDNNHDQ